MKYSKAGHPGFLARLGNVWYRHYRVYIKNLISNGLPPFLEPRRAAIEAGLKSL